MENKCKTKVSELMLPLAEYAIVNDNASVAEALKTLKKKNDENRGRKHPHRAVLVKDSLGIIVGKLGHFSILHGILENPVTQFKIHAQNILQNHPEMVARASENLQLLDENMDVIIDRAKSIPVTRFMQPISSKIEEDASLVEAIRMFDEYQALSLIVTKDNNVVGVLRIADLFDEIAENIRKSDR